MAARRPYRKWLDQSLKRLAALPPPKDVPPAHDRETLLVRQQVVAPRDRAFEGPLPRRHVPRPAALPAWDHALIRRVRCATALK